jgi:hypothetical protein
MRETFEASDEDLMPEVEHRDHLVMSERYYMDGVDLMKKGFILDGLVSLHLSREHLDGPFAPYGLSKIRSLEKTFGLLDHHIVQAKKELRDQGPLRIPRGDGSGANVDRGN